MGAGGENSKEAIPYFKSLSGLQRLNLHGPPLEDDSLKQIARLTTLRSLRIHGDTTIGDIKLTASRGFSDSGIAYLTDHPNLRFIAITNAGLTDRSLKTFGTIRNLQFLTLQGNHFTDEGLKYLAEMTNLSQLIIDGGETHISDAGAAHLTNLVNLESLWLQGCTLTDRGLTSLLRAKKLRSLQLSGGQFTDDGLRRLVEACPELVQLGFDADHVTGKGIDHLRSLSKLTFITLRHAKHIDPVVFARLKEALPSLTVFDTDDVKAPEPDGEAGELLKTESGTVEVPAADKSRQGNDSKKRKAKPPSVGQVGELKAPPIPVTSLTAKDGKVDKQAFLAFLRERTTQQAEVIRTGQANYRSIERSWGLGYKEKFYPEPSTVNMQGKIIFDRENFYMDATGRREPSRTFIIDAEGHRKPSTAEHDDVKRHTILTKNWFAEWNGHSDVVQLQDPRGGYGLERFDPRVMSKAFVANSERLDVKQVTYEGRTCYRLEEVRPRASVRHVQILDPQRDFVPLRREVYYDNASRGQREKLREDYPFYVFTFDYLRDEGSGVSVPCKCVWQQFETIPLAENRKPKLDMELTTEFTDYSFQKPPANVFTLYHLSVLGAHRLRDNREGHAQEHWYNLPAPGNLADPNSVPNVKGLPPHLAEQWLKDAAAAQ